MEGIKGLEKMIRTMDTIKDKGLKKATRAGINAALTPLTKAIRSQINSSPASSDVKKAARKLVGKSLKKRRGTYQGKAGFAVGSKGKAKKNQEEHTGPGVGIGARNIHWFTLGTEQRTRKSGGATGQITPDLKGLIAPAAASAGPAMLAAARAKVSQVLAREAAKARK